MMQDQILAWLKRPVLEKSNNFVVDLAAMVATDRGVSRSENQDRAVIMRVRPNRPAGSSAVVFALADGMGGMWDGSHCAALSIAAFLQSFAESSEWDTAARLNLAFRKANQAVFAEVGGKGGSTLSVVAVDDRRRAFVGNVGDSRVYSFDSQIGVKRLTVDDSLEEAVGGHGRELLQFIGMGEGIRPAVHPFDSPCRKFVITSDGVHYIAPETLEQIILNAGNLRMVAERLMFMARWCGGPDNATLIAADLSDPVMFEEVRRFSPVELWDPLSALQMVSVTPVGTTAPSPVKPLQQPVTPSERSDEGSSPVLPLEEGRGEKTLVGAKGAKSTSNKRKGGGKPRKGKADASPKQPAPEIQFEIRSGRLEEDDAPAANRQ